MSEFSKADMERKITLEVGDKLEFFTREVVARKLKD